MLIRLYLSKKLNTEKLTKHFAVTEEIKLGVINFRDSSYSLAYPLYKLALTRILPELTKKNLKLNAFSKKLSNINLSQTIKGK